MPATPSSHTSAINENEPGGLGRAALGRRTFVGYLVGGTTLTVAADLVVGATPAQAVTIPSAPQIPEIYDLLDAQNDAALPTSLLIRIVLNEDGTVSFALPRSENGQGITTSTAMIIADELDLPIDRVNVTLAPARPELLFNQLTGGSNTTSSTFTPIRVACAVARGALLQAASIMLGAQVTRLTIKAGEIIAPDGSKVGFGELATRAAVPETSQVEVTLPPRSDFSVIGRDQNRVDAPQIVTGEKKFVLDLDVPDALPTMVCRPPTLNGSPRGLLNQAAIEAMPGVTDVAQVETGIAVRAATFGQCIDAIRAMEVEWNPGSVEGESDQTILARVRRAQLPMVVPKVPLLAKQTDMEFTFMFRSSAALEPNCAIADVRSDSAEIWAGLKAPNVAHADIVAALKLPPTAVRINVVTGGGSFGHKLFGDAAIEAAKISQKMGKPVKLLWHRADEPRQGRVHPLCTSRIRATTLAGKVLSFEQRHTSVSTDFSHGFGDMLTSIVSKLPTGLGNLGLSETVFTLTQELPYNFGVITQLLNETDLRFNTGSMRNIYSPDVACANELMVDVLAKQLRKDPLAFRLEHLKSGRVKDVLRRAAELGGWGSPTPAGVAQGIAIHKEYKGATAVMVELDCRPQTINRPIRDGVTGPRVTKAVVVVDAGLAINPNGIRAQMMGGFIDGMSLALTSSLHLRDGHFLEASWDNYFYARQWNVPQDFQVEVVDSDVEEPGGVGEAGVAPSVAAIACAYARATGRVPTKFPINHDDPIDFEIKTFVPPVPESPTDGLDFTI